MSKCIYEDYHNYVKNIVHNEHSCKNFKSNPIYRGMLEHVNYEQGREYLKYIYEKTNYTNNEIINFCLKNDSYGNPIKNNYNEIGTVSPSSLRYIFQTFLILNHAKSLNLDTIDIVEIGGGYGGLCLCIKFFADKFNINISSYRIIDLEHIIKLQEKYLKHHNINDVNFVNACTFGKDINCENLFLISNYCFSEINMELQKEYIKNLFPKVKHGFIAWNYIDVYNFGFEIKVENEYPLTCNINKYVYF